ncbi:hypothetical protein X975_10559, partial [Stegodyphus mimosarum]
MISSSTVTSRRTITNQYIFLNQESISIFLNLAAMSSSCVMLPWIPQEHINAKFLQIHRHTVVFRLLKR